MRNNMIAVDDGKGGMSTINKSDFDPRRHKLHPTEWEGYINKFGWLPSWGAFSDRLREELCFFLSADDLRSICISRHLDLNPGNSNQKMWFVSVFGKPDLGKLTAEKIEEIRTSIDKARAFFHEAETVEQVRRQQKNHLDVKDFAMEAAFRYVNHYETDHPPLAEPDPDSLSRLMPDGKKRLAVWGEKPIDRLPREAFFVANMLIHDRNPLAYTYKPDRRHSDITVSGALSRRIHEIVGISEGRARDYLKNEGFRLPSPPSKKTWAVKIIG